MMTHIKETTKATNQIKMVVLVSGFFNQLSSVANAFDVIVSMYIIVFLFFFFPGKFWSYMVQLIPPPT